MVRIRSWAEAVRAEEADRALRQLPPLSANNRMVLESLSTRLVEQLLSPPGAFAKKTSDAMPNSRRLPIVCRMFERQGARCETSHCIAVGAIGAGGSLEDGCGMVMIRSEKNRGKSL